MLHSAAEGSDAFPWQSRVFSHVFTLKFSKQVNIDILQVGVFFGGLAIAKDEQVLKNNCPHIVVGTPGRYLLCCIAAFCVFWFL